MSEYTREIIERYQRWCPEWTPDERWSDPLPNGYYQPLSHGVEIPMLDTHPTFAIRDALTMASMPFGDPRARAIMVAQEAGINL